VGGVLFAAGIVLLAFADQHRAGFIISGTLATVLGLLFFAPLAIRALARAGRHAPISIRLALRDLARYQARSGAALGAVTLAIGIAATIAISASAAQTPTVVGNLPSNQLMLYLTPTRDGGIGVPPLSTAQHQAVTTAIDQLAAAVHATTVLPLEQAYNPQVTSAPGHSGQPAGYDTPSLAKVTVTTHGTEVSNPITLYVATPEVLAHYGINTDQISPTTDIIAARNDLGSRQVWAPEGQAGPPGAATAQPGATRAAGRPTGPEGITHPSIQTFNQLPNYSSAPGTLITTHAMQSLGLQPLPAAWLLETSHPPVNYIPQADIRTELIVAAPGRSWCEFKGTASYVSIRANGRVSERAGWLYADPTPAYRAIAGHIAFYASRIDEARVGGELVVPQPGDFYGGWVTSRIVGPFKGGPGTMRW